MNVESHDTGTADRTVLDIAQTVKKYSGDIGPLKNMDLKTAYIFVRSMPYRRDPAGTEVVSRPKFILQFGPEFGRDCKKQSTLLASWANENNVPYKFCVVSSRPDKKPHHIFVTLFVGGNWVDADATYNYYNLGERRSYTYRKEYEVVD